MSERTDEFVSGDIIVQIGHPMRFVVCSSGYELYYIRVWDTDTGKPGMLLEKMPKYKCHSEFVKLEHRDPDDIDWSVKPCGN